MWTLGIDSCSDTAAVALLKDEEPVINILRYSIRSHSTILLPMIDKILSEAKINLFDIDLISVSSGPGSYTGIRIGLSTVKGLCASGRIKACIGVSSLESLAYQFIDRDYLICPLLNARNDNAYNSLFVSDGKGMIERLREDSHSSLYEIGETLYDFSKKISSSYSGIILPGDMNNLLNSHKAFGKIDIRFLDEKTSKPNGFGTALAGYYSYTRSNEKSKYNMFALTPVYLRETRADRKQ